jgi:hypothetical protein
VICRVDPLKVPRAIARFTEEDLVTREFLPHTSRRVRRDDVFRAA